jgi:HK97 family phage portal protein
VKVEIAQDNMLHVRGWDPTGAPQARTPVDRHRNTIGKTAARSRFEERFLANDARPSVVITMPQGVTRDQAAEFLALWDDRHKGNPGKTNLIGGGGDIKTLPVSFRDAQFIEAEAFGVTDVARIFDWPADLLGRETERPFVEVMAWAVRLHLMPRLQRIEASLGDDPDLFGSSSKYRPYFDVSELLRGDAGTMASVFHQLVQVGVMTPNEARLPLGLPPIEGGDDLQATPVGGAPNADGSMPPAMPSPNGNGVMPAAPAPK